MLNISQIFVAELEILNSVFFSKFYLYVMLYSAGCYLRFMHTYQCVQNPQSTMLDADSIPVLRLPAAV